MRLECCLMHCSPSARIDPGHSSSLRGFLHPVQGHRHTPPHPNHGEVGGGLCLVKHLCHKFRRIEIGPLARFQSPRQTPKRPAHPASPSFRKRHAQRVTFQGGCFHDATLPNSKKTLNKDGKQIGKGETARRPAECWKRLGGDCKRQACLCAAHRWCSAHGLRVTQSATRRLYGAQPGRHGLG